MQKIAYIFCLLLFSMNTFAEDIPSDSVERAKLAKKVERRIAMEYGMVDAIMPQINIYLKKGEKIQAREMVNDALERIARIEADQRLLAQLDKTADEETLMIAETQETKRYLTLKASQLRNIIGLFISCDAKLFDTNYTSLEGEIQGDLSELGVFFVDSIGQADWAIYVHAEAHEHAKTNFGSVINYAAYVEVHIDIDQLSSNKRVYSNGLTSDIANHTKGFEQAAWEAYKNICPQICTIIQSQINQ